jgi:hypothetical protein
MMEIAGDRYRVVYDPAVSVVAFQGILRLKDRFPLNKQLVDAVAAGLSKKVTLDVRQLEFLNSNGVVLLFKFIADLHDLTGSQIVIRGSTRYPWQVRWLRDMSKFMAELQLDWE